MVLARSPAQDGARYPHTAPYTDRRIGRLPDSQPPKPARAVAAHPSGSAHVRQHTLMPSVTADHRQAEYFLQLLVESRLEVGNRIDEHHRAIAIAEIRRDPGQVQRLRRLVGIGEHERDVVDGLIDNLQRRFPIGHGAGVPTISRRARSVVH